MSREGLLWHLLNAHGFKDSPDVMQAAIVCAIEELDRWHNEEHKLNWSQSVSGRRMDGKTWYYYHDHPGMNLDDDLEVEYYEKWDEAFYPEEYDEYDDYFDQPS